MDNPFQQGEFSHARKGYQGRSLPDIIRVIHPLGRGHFGVLHGQIKRRDTVSAPVASFASE
jgi:hypothetical protein